MYSIGNCSGPFFLRLEETRGFGLEGFTVGGLAFRGLGFKDSGLVQGFRFQGLGLRRVYYRRLAARRCGVRLCRSVTDVVFCILVPWMGPHPSGKSLKPKP